jgi:small-conductance mechanosensitive channel
VKDIITGVFLLLEDAVAVGDSVNVGGKGGVVEHLSIRSIKLRDGDGSIHIVPFSTVTTVTNSTRDFAFAMADILVSYETNTDEAGAAIKAIVSEMRTEPRFDPRRVRLLGCRQPGSGRRAAARPGADRADPALAGAAGDAAAGEAEVRGNGDRYPAPAAGAT